MDYNSLNSKMENAMSHYEKELGADWIYSIKGYLLFNPILYVIIKSIYSVIRLQIFIRYMVIYSVIAGARASK